MVHLVNIINTAALGDHPYRGHADGGPSSAMAHGQLKDVTGIGQRWIRSEVLNCRR